MVQIILNHFNSIMVALGLILTAIVVWVAYQRVNLHRETKKKEFLAMDRERVKEIRGVLVKSFNPIARMSKILVEVQAKIRSRRLRIEKHVGALKGKADNQSISDLDLMSDSLSFVEEGYDLETYEECLIALDELTAQTENLINSVRSVLAKTPDVEKFLAKTITELIPFKKDLEEIEQIYKDYHVQMKTDRDKLEKIVKQFEEINNMTKMI